ncbi:efflux RND transporter periplasmic adaptor subunit [Methylobacterium trifolii]|uniref:Cobalt-zinc-cadmium resistance protein CzcB n=1 Tax=Methylobacterium trifolii TaxID=1003092 RepID=A0ABQ4TS33_9HYPH|nr:efflux RND transporter periplasmic adaptor subunit [Methylobacterium trifolii]GJE58111.1 Cobalt-zinc-cadmium resistance protein CzcB [Methylobacterium trifolii]
MFRYLAIPAALAAGVAAGALVPDLSGSARTWLAAAGVPLPGQPRPAAGKAPEAEGHDHDGHEHEKPAGRTAQGGHDHAGHDHAHADGDEHDREGRIFLDEDQIAAAGITVVPATEGVIARSVTVPGTVVPDADRVARVAAKVVGTVAELRKRLGDTVAKGEVVAVLDSREVADAKNDYIAARVGLDLQETLFERDHALWDKKISAEQQFLRARTSLIEAQLKADLARQKLSALGVPDAEAEKLGEKPPALKLVAGEDGHLAGLRRAPLVGLQRYELRAPIAGRVIERRVDVGAPVNDEGQEKEIYTIADLSRVWVELAVPVSDLGGIAQGQAVALARGAEPASRGSIVFVSPVLDPQTRSAKVIAAVENPDMAWRPGSFATVSVAVGKEPVRLRVARASLQTVEGATVVFVRTASGFEKRAVTLGRGDADQVEIVTGLEPGEGVAVANSFVLKAELGKSEAEHAH